MSKNLTETILQILDDTHFSNGKPVVPLREIAERITKEVKNADFLTRLRLANAQRQADVFPHCNDWTLIDSSNELAGEAGEVCNATKKLKRDAHEFTTHGPYESVQHAVDAAMPWFKRKIELEQNLRDEIADVLIVLDLLAWRAGINLEEVTVSKFNAVSRKRNSEVML